MLKSFGGYLRICSREFLESNQSLILLISIDPEKPTIMP
jgi:hypothetical protein